MAETYDRNTTGWESLGSPRDATLRPENERQRCGPYTGPDGEPAWGDHRVTLPGTTCVEVDCRVAHHPTGLPGWAEPMEGFHDRAGAQPIAAALWGWDAAGMLPRPLGDTCAWVAAHVALDALRDAGYRLVRDEPGPGGSKRSSRREPGDGS